MPFTSQSTSSCSDSEIRLPVESFVIPSMAATAENAQQHPIAVMRQFVSIPRCFEFLFCKRVHTEPSTACASPPSMNLTMFETWLNKPTSQTPVQEQLGASSYWKP
nr:hypothetical protein Iba_chr06eCG10130 [Ipomoea batatas]